MTVIRGMRASSPATRPGYTSPTSPEGAECHAGPRDNRSDAELRADFEQLTASERIAQTAALSRTLTGIAGCGR
jgi:hypothetical protein